MYLKKIKLAVINLGMIWIGGLSPETCGINNMYACVQVYTHTRVFVYTAYRGQRSMSGVFPQLFSTLLFEDRVPY